MSMDAFEEFLKNPDYLNQFGDSDFCLPLDEEFDEHLRLVEETFDWGRDKNDPKGKRLEHLATYLLKRLKCVQVIHDLRIESNQIDHKITLTPMAMFHPFLKEIGLNFISECKNEAGTIGVGHIQKVANLLHQHSLKLGILFSRKRIAGRGWKDAEGRRKKVYCQDKEAIIGFTFEELVELRKKDLNLLTEIVKKYEQLKFDIEIDDVSTEEDDWYEDQERIKAVLHILHKKAILTDAELNDKLKLLSN